MYKHGDAIAVPKARKNMPAAEQLLRNRADRLGVSNKVRIMGIQTSLRRALAITHPQEKGMNLTAAEGKRLAEFHRLADGIGTLRHLA